MTHAVKLDASPETSTLVPQPHLLSYLIDMADQMTDLARTAGQAKAAAFLELAAIELKRAKSG